MISKEIFIQYEELYLPSGDGILLSFKDDSTNFLNNPRMNPKMLDESGNITKLDNIPETYRFYCSNDLDYLSQTSKAALATAKELYMVIYPYHRGYLEFRRINAYKIDIMGITVYKFPLNPVRIKTYRWFTFYVEQ